MGDALDDVARVEDVIVAQVLDIMDQAHRVGLNSAWMSVNMAAFGTIGADRRSDTPRRECSEGLANAPTRSSTRALISPYMMLSTPFAMSIAGG